MRFFTTIFLAISLVAPALTSPTIALRDVERYQGQTTGKYIINFKKQKGVSRRNWAKKLKIKASDEWDLVNGFAGR